MLELVSEKQTGIDSSLYSQVMENLQKEDEGNKNSDTQLSNNTYEKTVASFKKLSKTIEARQKKLEELHLNEITKELLEPMLKEWIDNNLAEVVEEAVEREIRKITAEYS